MIKTLGIDIGSYSIKVAEVHSTSKGFQVVQFIEHPLKVIAGSDQELEIIEYLRDLVSKYDGSTRFVVGLRQDRVAIRNKFFPFNDRIKISKSLPFELEEDLPFSAENAVYDAKIIRFLGGGAEVLACATPKNHVKNCIQRSMDAGFEPYLISSEGTALANIFENWNDAPITLAAPSLELGENERSTRNIQIILNIGHTHTLVSAMEGRSLIGVRSILWGGHNIAQAISKKYEIPYYDALNELKNKAFILTNKQGATFDQVTFSDTIAKSVREMTRDLQLTLLEFKSEFNAHIESLALTGGASQIQNLGPFLTQIIEVPANRISSLDLIPNVLFERSPDVSAKIGVALGLAFEGFKKPRNPALNFMRGEFARENHELKSFLDKWGKTFQLSLAALVILFVYASLRADFAAQLTERTQETLKTQAKKVAKLKGKNASESGIKKYILENKKRASDLKILSSVAGMNSALDVLKKVTSATPAKANITLDLQNFDLHDSTVRLQGYVNSPQEATLLKQALSNVTADGSVKIETSTLRQLPNRTSFAYSFNVDRGIQKVTK